jgi:hypothetical protein
MVEIVGILLASRNGQNADQENVGEPMRHACRIARILDPAASLSAIPSRPAACAKSRTPPSELIRPPSNAAVTFLRLKAGKEKGKRLSSSMAGVAQSLGLVKLVWSPISHDKSTG